MKVKYLITGAAGNLGNSIVRKLCSQGADIRALVLPNDPSITKLPRGIEVVQGNVLNKSDMEHFFKVDKDVAPIVIHCAGIITISWNYDPLVYNVNVNGTRNIVEQCVANKVKKLVYISSVHAIPERPKGQVITEITSFDPDQIIGFYGKTKAEASQIVMDAVKNQGLDASIIFPSGICGPYDYAKGLITKLLVDCCHGRLPVGVQGGYDFVDVRDVAKGVIECCQKGKKGEGYILSNQYISIKEILHQVHLLTKLKEVKNMIPVWLAKAFLPLIHLYSKVTKLTPVFTRYSLYTLTSNSLFSSEKAKKVLGFSVRPFIETISDTLMWLKIKKEISY